MPAPRPRPGRRWPREIGAAPWRAESVQRKHLSLRDEKGGGMLLWAESVDSEEGAAAARVLSL